MYKNSRSTVLLPLVVAAAVALGIFLGQFLGRSSAESDIKGILRSLALPQNKVSQTLSLIETQYVDSVAIDSLVERALPVIVSELDPHSVYIPASEMAEINEPLDGEFDGIGVVFNMATDTVIVLNVIPSGPSDKATASCASTIRWWPDNRSPSARSCAGCAANAARRCGWGSNGAASTNWWR